MPVNASFDKTWSAVIDVFAARSIPIRTIDKASGLIATDELAVGSEGTKWADCGSKMGMVQRPNAASYNVRVKGDAEHSTVQMTVTWQNAYPGAIGPRGNACSTKGVWETEAETDVKTHAESR